MSSFKSILLPTDFSDYSKYARAYAISLCREFKAKLLALHVLEDPVYPIDTTPFGFSPVQFVRERRDSAEKELEKVVEEIAKEGIETESLIVEGKPFVQIITVAREREVDLIVIGTHGRTGLSHYLLGSVTEKVVRKAPCPVLTVRKHGQEFVLP